MATTLSYTSPRRSAATGSRRPTSPPLGVLAVISLGLALAGLVAFVAAGRAYALPFVPTGQPLDYSHHGIAIRLGATLLFASAVPLGIFAAAGYTRLLRLGVRVPGPSIGFFGGVTASLLLMISAAAGWVLSSSGIGGSAAVTRALSSFAYVTGGVGYVIGLGLLVAGVAVSALMLRRTPRWLAWTGPAIAAVSEVAFVAMAIPSLQVLLPVARCAGLPCLLSVGVLVPIRRPAAAEDRP